MLCFDPPALENEVATATRAWNDFFESERVGISELTEGFVDITSEDYDPNDHEDETISSGSTFELMLPECDDAIEMSYGDFIAMSGELQCLHVFMGLTTTNVVDVRPSAHADISLAGCRSDKRWLLRIAPVDADADRFINSVIRDAATDEERELIDQLVEQRREVAACYRRLHKTSIDQKDQGGSSAPNKAYGEAYHVWSRAVDRRDELSRMLDKPTERYYSTHTHVNGKDVICSLTRGFTIMGVAFTALGYYEDWQPPIGPDELFIEVQYQQELSEEEVTNVFQAYLFEFSSTLGIEFHISPRMKVFEVDWTDGDSENLLSSEKRLRPLLLGKGLNELLELYNRAVSTFDSDVRILYFTKVIEYVSQTVVRQQATHAIRAKLLSPRALQADAEFITELEAVMEEQRNYRKDREAIKQTIGTCCVATELSRFAPVFLIDLKRISATSKAKDQEDALSKFALSLYATRNLVAHAKANYNPTGEECPEEQLAEFAKCAQVAAQQAIRWYEFNEKQFG